MPRAPTALNVKVIEHAKAINDETGLPQNAPTLKDANVRQKDVFRTKLLI